MPQVVSLRSNNTTGNIPRFSAPGPSGLEVPLQEFYNPKYDKNYRVGMNQLWNRADNQAWYKQLGYGFMNRAMSIAPKVLAGLGSVGMALTVPFTDNTVEDIWDNQLTNWANHLDEDLMQKILPVYTSREYQTGNLLSKMMTTSFWATDFMDGLAFAASAYVPGSAIGKLTSLAGKALNSGRIGAGMLEFFQGMGATAEGVNLLTATAYNTIAEASAEAYQTQQELMATYIAQGMSTEDAKVKSAEQAKEVFGANAAVLAIPNLIQNKFFHGTWAGKVDEVRNAAVKTGGNATTEGLASSRWSKVLEGIASEGLWEENVQSGIQQYERAIANGEEDPGLLAGVANNMLTNIKGLGKSFFGMETSREETDGATAIFLGGLLGTGFGVLGHKRELDNYKALVKDENDAVKNFFSETVPTATSLLRDNIQSIYKVDGETKVKVGDKEVTVPKFMLDENGDPQFDEDKLLNMTYSQLRDTNLWNMQMLAAFTGNRNMDAFNKELSLASYAYHLATTANRYDEAQLKELLDKFSDTAEKEAKQDNIETFARENNNKVFEYIKTLRELNTKNNTAKDQSDSKKVAFNNFITRGEFYLKSKLNAIQAIRDNGISDEAGAQLDTVEKDTMDQLDQIYNNKKGLRKFFLEGAYAMTNLAIEQQQLNEKPGKTQEDLERLQELNYLRAEDTYINGNHINRNTGTRTFPIGILSANMVKTVPGSRDNYNYQTGKSHLALDKAESLLDNNEAEKALVTLNDEYVVDVDNQRATALSERALAPVMEQAAQLQQASQDLDSLINTTDALSIMMVNGDTLGEHLEAEGHSQEEIDKIIDDANNKLGLPVDRDTEMSDDFLDDLEHAIAAVGPELAQKENIDKALANISKFLEDRRNFRQRTDKTSLNRKAFHNAENKEMFLKEDFYNQDIKEPVENFIDFVRDNIDVYDQLSKVVEKMNVLKSVITAYKNRKDANNPTSVPISAEKLLDILETELLPRVQKNLGDRNKIQNEFNNTQIELLNSYFFSNPEISTIIKEVLGPEEYTKLSTILNTQHHNENIRSYDAFEYAIAEVKKKASAEQKSKIVAALRSMQKAQLAKMMAAAPKDKLVGQTVVDFKYYLEEKEWYAKMPSLLFPQMVGWLFKEELQSTDAGLSSLHKFLNDLDPFALNTRLDSIKGITDSQRQAVSEMISVHFGMLAINKALFNFEKSNLNHDKLLEIKEFLTLGTAPSLQQNIIMMDVLNFLHSSTDSKDFDNFFLATGIGGSGKTFILGKLLAEIYSKLNGKDMHQAIYAFSSNSRTTDNINKAIFDSPKPNRSFDAFMNLKDSELDLIDVVIIDEVFTLTNEQIHKVSAKLYNYNEHRKNSGQASRVIKVVALGDHSQKRIETNPVLLSTSAFNLKTTIPLTTSYRTAVDSISLFANDYRMSPVPVTTATAIGNMDVAEMIANPSEAVGTFDATESQILQALNTPSSRSRVLIVGTDSDVATYKRMLPNTEVVSVQQAQGYQWDEVYVIIDPVSQTTGDTIIQKNFSINQGLYTAFSRAKNLLVVSGVGGISTTLPNKDLDKSSQQNVTDLSRNSAKFVHTVDVTRKARNLFYGIPQATTVTAEQTFVSKESPDTDPNIAGTSAEPSFAEYQNDPMEHEDAKDHFGGSITLQYPTNYNLRPVFKEGKLTSPVRVNSVGRIIRSKQKGKELLHLVAPSNLEDGKWVHLGTLSERDTKDNPELLAFVNRVSGSVNDTEVRRKGAFSINNLDDITVGTFTVRNFSRLRTWHNENNSRYDNDSQDVIEQAIITFYDTFFTHDNKPIDVYDADGNLAYPENDWVIVENGVRKVNWKVVKNKVEFRIITKKHLKEVPDDFNVIVGAPYLIITDTRQRNSDRTSTRRMYIRFQPNEFSTSSKHYSSLRGFYDAMQQVEELSHQMGKHLMLGTEMLDTLIDAYANRNFELKSTITEDNGTKFAKKELTLVSNPESIASMVEFPQATAEGIAALDKALRDAVMLTHGPDLSRLVFTDAEAAEKYLRQNASKDSEDNWILETDRIDPETGNPKTVKIVGGPQRMRNGKYYLQYAIDPTNETLVKPYEIFKVVSGRGPAQRAMNSIGQANTSVGNTNIRTYIKIPGKDRTVKIGRSKSLYSSKEYLDVDKFNNDPRVQDSGWLDYSAEIQREENRNPTITDFVDFYESLGNERKDAMKIVTDYTTPPITLQTLSAIAGDEAMQNGKHTELREPLQHKNDQGSGVSDIGTNQAKLANRETRRSITSKLRTDFTRMSRSSVTVGFEKVDKPDGPKPSTTLKDVLDMIPDMGPELNEVKNLLMRIDSKHQVPVHFTKQVRLPNGQVLSNINVAVPDPSQPGGAVVYTAYTPQELQAGNPIAVGLVLHELLHAVTIGEIDKGRLDLANGIDSKEALFVKRLKAIQRRFHGQIARKGIKRSEVYFSTSSKLSEKELIANLSNPKFRKVAKELPATTIKGKSIIREIIEAIMDLFKDFFGIDTNKNIYDVMVKTLEDYYNMLPEDVTTPTKISSPKENVAKLVKAFETILTDLNPESLQRAKEKSIGIFVTSKMPGVVLAPGFVRKSDVEQESILRNLYATLMPGQELSFAYVDTPGGIMSSNPGAITDLQDINVMARYTFAGAFPEETGQQNLLVSILHKQLASPETNLIANLIHYANNNDINNIIGLAYYDLFSTKDKNLVRELSDMDPVQYLIDNADNLQIVSDLLSVVNTLASYPDAVELITGTIFDRTAAVYRIARDFVLDEIRNNLANLHSGNSLYMFSSDFRNYLNNLANSVDISSLELQAATYHSQLESYRSRFGELSEQEESAYYHILFTSLPAIQNQIVALSALRKTNVHTGNKLVFDLYKDIFPTDAVFDLDDTALSAQLYEMSEERLLSEDILDEEIAEATGIMEHIKQYNKSYERTLSESMKMFLVKAGARQTGQASVPMGLMYVKSMQWISVLDFTELSNMTALDSLENQITAIIESDSISELDTLVLRGLRNVINTAKSETYRQDIGLVSRLASNGLISYAVVQSQDGSNVENVTYEQALKDNNYTVTELTDKSATLYSHARSVDRNMTPAQFNNLINKHEAINVVRGIQNNMGSMKETDLYIATRKISGGQVMRFIRSKAAGISFTVKEEIRQNLTDSFHKDTNNLITKALAFNNKQIGGRTAAVVAVSGTNEEKIKYIKKFYDEILGLGKVKLGLNAHANNSGEINDLVNKIIAFLSATSNVSTRVSDTVKVEDLSTIDNPIDNYVDPFTAYINNIDGYLTAFSEIVTRSNDFVRNPSVSTLKGDKFYKWHESSTGYDVLNALIDVHKDNPIFKGTNGSNSNRRVPEFISSSFFDHNIFVKAQEGTLNKLFSVGEYEGAKNLDVNSGTPYLRENFFYFQHRKFIQAFLDGIRQSTEDHLRYFQFTYIPSEKPKHPVVSINVLKDTKEHPEVRNAMVAAITQLVEKQSWRLDVAGYNESQTSDLFRNFTVAKDAIDRLNARGQQVELNAEGISIIADTALEILSEQAMEMAKRITSSDVKLKFDSGTYKILRKLSSYTNEKFSSVTSKYDADTQFKSTNKIYEESPETILNDILPAYDLFYKNNYLNSYFLNQLIAGDFSSYSGGSAGMVKRYAGVFAPRIRGLVDSQIGMREKFQTLILADTHVSKEDTTDVLKELLFGSAELSSKEQAEFDRLIEFFDKKGYDRSDAQGFMTPARKQELVRGFERSWNVGAVSKPVHFEIKQMPVFDVNGNPVLVNRGKGLVQATTPVPVYIKYSLVEISDEMLNYTKSDALRKLRDNMEKLGADEIVFGSAVKTGAPTVKNRNGEEVTLGFQDFINLDDAGLEELKSYQVSPMVELSNKYYGFQHNPSTNVNKEVSVYTQLMYFLSAFTNSETNDVGVHPELTQQAGTIYSLLGELIDMGREQFESKIDTDTKFIKFLREKFDGPGAERAIELINAGISWNHPLLEKKSIIAIASGMEKAAIRTKFSGGKLVLQTSEGVHLQYENAPNVGKELEYKMEMINGRATMVAEVIVPTGMLTLQQRQAVRNGETLYLYGDGLAFRIPSTELHSAIPLKIVGTYDNKMNSNIIIAPKELVPIHGSDFDVDALFVIMREVYEPNQNAVVTAEQVMEYQELLLNTLAFIDSLQEGLTEQEQEVLINYRNGLREKYLLVQQSRREEDLANIELDQVAVNEQYENWIYNPNPTLRGDLIIRADIENFDDTRARKEWGAVAGYIWNEQNQSWRVQSELRTRIYNLSQELEEMFTGLPSLSKELADTIRASFREFQDLTKLDKLNYSSFLGEVGTAVGYESRTFDVQQSEEVDGALEFTDTQETYQVLNPNFINDLKNRKAELEDLKGTIHPDFRGILVPSINSSIATINKLIEKTIKNSITDAMLQVLTNPDNKFRMTTPITFKPLIDAIAAIPEELKPTVNYDLSNMSSEFDAYNSLSVGMILTGAFANAVKVFAYLSQAGEPLSNIPLREARSSLKKQIAVLKDSINNATEESLQEQYKMTLKALETEYKTVSEQMTANRRSEVGRTRGQVNEAYHFIVDGLGYDSMVVREREGKYNVTETFDTLINAAIDNLKQGLLSRGGINTLTGSAVVGGVFMGLDLDTITKILYLPIFAPIINGTENNVESFINDMADQLGDVYKNATPSVTRDEINAAVAAYAEATKAGKKVPINQEFNARILKVFSNINTVGQDVRQLASFLNIIRSMEVFTENIDGLDNKLNEMVSSVQTTEDGRIILEPSSTFSFVMPNLFQNNPHIEAAYKAHLGIVEQINNKFLLHSPEIRAFTKQAMQGLRLAKDDETSNSATEYADARTALGKYYLSQLVWDKVKDTPKRKFSFTTSKRKVDVLLSTTRSFLSNVAEDLGVLKEYMSSNNIRNSFMENLYIGRDSIGVPSISFSAGVNLNPEDVQQFVIDFKKLNQFDVYDGEVERDLNVSPLFVSELQDNLLTYAVLAFGLRYGGSNFSGFLPATMFRELDSRYNAALGQLLLDVVNGSPIIMPTAEHFKLSYAVQNASRLPYADFKNIESEGSGYNRQYAGFDKLVTPDGKALDVYYDRKITTAKKLPRFIKEGFGDKAVVFVRVADTDQYYYYQKLGKSSEVFFSPLTDPNYNIAKYFSPSVYTAQYFNRDGDYIYTYQKLGFLDKTPFYIVPSYNFDRTERELVALESVEEFKTGNFTGYKYKVAPMEAAPPAPTAVDPLALPPTIDVSPDTELSFADYVSDDLKAKSEDLSRDETGTYTNKKTSETFRSVNAKVIPEFQERQYKDAEEAIREEAKDHWKGQDPNTKLFMYNNEDAMDMESYVQYRLEKRSRAIAKGDLYHLKFHHYFSRDPLALVAMEDIKATYEITDGEIDWLDNETIKTIIQRRTGTDFWEKDRKDKILTEVAISSTILGMAGRLDMMIDHGDKILSLYDIKSGNTFNKQFETYMLKYGDTFGQVVWDDPRNKAKLQLMLYAFIMKSEDPELRFRELKILHIPSPADYYHDSVSNIVDPQPYLEIIEMYIKDTQPEVYQKLKDQKLFDAYQYSAVLPTRVADRPNLDPAMSLKLKMLELQQLIMYDKNIIGNVLKGQKTSKKRAARIKTLVSEINAMKSNKKMNLAAWDTDMSWADTWSGSMPYSTNPYVQLYHTMLSEQKQAARDKYQEWRKEYDALLDAVIEEKGLNTITKLFGGVNREKLFKNMLVVVDKGDSSTTRFLTDDFVLHPEDKAKWNELSSKEKALLTFMLDSMDYFFVDSKTDSIDARTGEKKALANRVITYKDEEEEKPVTNLDLFNRELRKSGQRSKKDKFKYSRGFYPKHPQTLGDVLKKAPNRSKALASYLWNKNFTNYYEYVFEGWGNVEEAIPMKYLGGNAIDFSGNYTMNVELAVDSFVKQHFYKQEMDQVYAYGQAMQIYLKLREDVEENVVFERTIEWFETSVNSHILGLKDNRDDWFTRKMKLKTGNKSYKQFNFSKFLRSLKKFYSGATMWLKPLTGLPNAIFASLLTLKEGMKNSFLISGSHANFGLGDIAEGFAVAMGMQFDAAMGKLRENKAYLLMEKFGYLPDNYDWYTSPNQLLTAKNKWFSSRTMMFFHTAPEEVVATAIFVAQMKSLGIWDKYNPVTKELSNGTTYTTYEYVGTARGKRNIGTPDQPVYEDITGLTNEESNAIKFLYEKIHGGYRLDERTRLEYYVLGELVLQFKKYMPSIFKNVWASRGYRNTQGYFEEYEENGQTLKRWTPAAVEGRWRLFAGTAMAYLSGKKQVKPEGEQGSKFSQYLGFQPISEYQWDNLSPHMKDDIIDLYSTLAVFMLMLFGYHSAWDREEEDTLKKIYARIMRDFSVNVNPMEVMRNIANLARPVTITKLARTAEASIDLALSAVLLPFDEEAALTQRGELRGWTELQDNIHLLSSTRAIQRALEESPDLRDLLDYRAQ